MMKYILTALILLAALLLIFGHEVIIENSDNLFANEYQPQWSEYEEMIQRPLFEYATSEDPARVASTYGIDNHDVVLVVIELVPNAALPEGFMIFEDARVRNTVQAWVRADQLLELCHQSEILYMRNVTRPRIP
jgi:hypothetical protein